MWQSKILPPYTDCVAPGLGTQDPLTRWYDIPLLSLSAREDRWSIHPRHFSYGHSSKKEDQTPGWKKALGTGQASHFQPVRYGLLKLWGCWSLVLTGEVTVQNRLRKRVMYRRRLGERWGWNPEERMDGWGFRRNPYRFKNAVVLHRQFKQFSQQDV